MLTIGTSFVALALAATAGINTNQIRTDVPISLNLSGVSAAEGNALSVSRSNHTHSISGTLPQANGGTGAGALTCSAGQHITSNGTVYSCSADSGGAGTGLSFLTATSEATLSNETNLGALTTGLLKHTVTAGTSVPATASAGTDYGPPTSGNSTGLVLSTTGTGAHTAYTGVTGAANQWISALSASGAGTLTQPAFSNISGTATAAQIPTASTTLGGVKMAAACGAGNHVASIVAGELTCTADAGGGGGAPTTATYITQTADAGLSAEQALSSLSTGIVKVTTGTGVLSTAASGTDYGPPTSGNATGLVISTTTTGAHTAYAGTSCTNQFPRSLNASGAATCAGVAIADHTATGTPSATTYLRGDNTWSTPSGGGGGVGTMTQLTATWASSATSNTLGIIGTGGVPMTSPTYSAGAPFSFICRIITLRAATTNGPRYGLTTSGSFTNINALAYVGLAGTAPARTQNMYDIVAITAGTCTSGCTGAITTGTAARQFTDLIDGGGVMNASGTVSLQMAPSAAAANTAQIGSYCVWY